MNFELSIWIEIGDFTSQLWFVLSDTDRNAWWFLTDRQEPTCLVVEKNSALRRAEATEMVAQQTFGILWSYGFDTTDMIQ